MTEVRHFPIKQGVLDHPPPTGPTFKMADGSIVGMGSPTAPDRQVAERLQGQKQRVEDQKQKLESAIQKVPGVTSVDNQLQVGAAGQSESKTPQQ